MIRNTAMLFAVIVVVLNAIPEVAATTEDIDHHRSCLYCGMDRERFGFSRMLIEYEDGSSTGVCSLHCAAIELALSLDKTPRSIKTADYGSRQLIDAEKAFWVIGGNKPGVMTKRAKWAFANREDAEIFIRKNTGKLVDFDRAMKAAYEDMYDDTKMIRDRRKERSRMQSHEH